MLYNIACDYIPFIRPLELSKVAELKYACSRTFYTTIFDVGAYRTLLPDLIKFAYIPQNDLRVNADPQIPESNRQRDRSPDFTIPDATTTTGLNIVEPEEHVLILEFAENSKGKKTEGSVNPLEYKL